MVNHGQLNWAPEGNETHQIEPGYYSGGTLDTSKVYEQGKIDLLRNTQFLEQVHYELFEVTGQGSLNYELDEGYYLVNLVAYGNMNGNILSFDIGSGEIIKEYSTRCHYNAVDVKTFYLVIDQKCSINYEFKGSGTVAGGKAGAGMMAIYSINDINTN